jgi:hypothetical protein
MLRNQRLPRVHGQLTLGTSTRRQSMSSTCNEILNGAHHHSCSIEDPRYSCLPGLRRCSFRVWSSASYIGEVCIYLPIGHQPPRSSQNLCTYSHDPSPFVPIVLHGFLPPKAPVSLPLQSRGSELHHTTTSRVEPMGQIARRIPYSQPQTLSDEDERLSLISGDFVSTLRHAFCDRRWSRRTN